MATYEPRSEPTSEAEQMTMLAHPNLKTDIERWEHFNTHPEEFEQYTDDMLECIRAAWEGTVPPFRPSFGDPGAPSTANLRRMIEAKKVEKRCKSIQETSVYEKWQASQSTGAHPDNAFMWHAGCPTLHQKRVEEFTSLQACIDFNVGPRPGEPGAMPEEERLPEEERKKVIRFWERGFFEGPMPRGWQ